MTKKKMKVVAGEKRCVTPNSFSRHSRDGKEAIKL